MKNNDVQITVRQLRSLLFNIDNENLTVKELRRQLYEVDNQDQKLEDSFGTFSRLGIGLQADKQNK